jgi:hypothetical protein
MFDVSFNANVFFAKENMKLIVCIATIGVENTRVKFFVLAKRKRWSINIRNFLAANLELYHLYIVVYPYIIEPFVMRSGIL